MIEGFRRVHATKLALFASFDETTMLRGGGTLCADFLPPRPLLSALAGRAHITWVELGIATRRMGSA